MTSSAARRKFLQSLAAAGAASFVRAAKTTSVLAATEGSSQPAPPSGIEQPALVSFDRMMLDFMREQELVGSALAVARQGRLVYARGFGLADRDESQPVQPAALFRIASISKPLTAVATLQLVERGRVKLDDTVCDVLELAAPKDPRWRQITIDHLLHHTGGWDRDKSFDPMFRSVKIAEAEKTPPPAMPGAIIRYMLEQPLDFDPGQQYAYSNFGYCLLGRVIERVTGRPYGAVVRRNVFARLGAKRSRLGATLKTGRAKGEVCYYDRKDRTAAAVMGDVGSQVPLPYGAWCLEAMDAHGGWIASAVDLVRFASALDRGAKPRLLRPDSMNALVARPEGPPGLNAEGQPKDVWYGCGWSVRRAGDGFNTWHTGALDGTSTLLVRRQDGLSWAVLFNYRKTTDGGELAGKIDPLLHTAAKAVTEWPSEDQFSRWL